MKTARVVFAALLFPLALSAQDSLAATSKDQTLMQRIGLKGLQISFGAGSAPYMGRANSTAGTAEVRYGATFRRFPDWTITYAASFVADWDTTAYVAPNSDGYHPHMAASASSFELQRRWASTSLVHPVASVGYGEIVNSYNYYRFPKGGGSEFHQDETTRVSFTTLSVGGEVNVSGWARFLVTGGYRAAGSSRIANGMGSNSGFSSVAVLELGKF